jgi:PKD repeat protein
MVSFSWDDGMSDELFLGAGEFSAGMSHVYEEAGIYQVVITLVDSDGGDARGEWTVIVGEVASVDAGPDVIIDEGSMFISSGFLGDSESVTYTAFVDYYDDSGAVPLELYSGNTFDLRHQYHENGIYTVLVMVFNDGMEYGEDTVEVTVNNIDPLFESLSLFPNDAVYPNTAVQVTGTFSDPGILDAHTITFDWGDGSSVARDLDAGVFVLSGSHSYAKAGNYTVLVTILDDDGGMCNRSMKVVVKTPPVPSAPPSTDSIKRYVAGLKIPLGLKLSFLSALDIVPHLLKHHMIRAAMNQLRAFIHFVDAQSGKRLTHQQAQTLMNAARSIIQSLNIR